MKTQSRAWVETIESGAGYRRPESARFRQLVEQARSRYGLVELLRRLIRPGERVLEAGCGWALTSFALAAEGVPVTAMDVSVKLIDALLSLRDELGAPWTRTLTPARGDIFTLGQHPERYDVIFSDGVYEHFLESSERRELLAAFGAALKPGGRLVLAVPNIASPFFRSAVDARMPAMKRLSGRELAREMEAGGFRVLERGELFVNPGFEQWLRSAWMSAPIRAFDRVFRHLPRPLKKMTAAHIYCAAVRNS